MTDHNKPAVRIVFPSGHETTTSVGELDEYATTVKKVLDTFGGRVTCVRAPRGPPSPGQGEPTQTTGHTDPGPAKPDDIPNHTDPVDTTLPWEQS